MIIKYKNWYTAKELIEYLHDFANEVPEGDKANVIRDAASRLERYLEQYDEYPTR